MINIVVNKVYKLQQNSCYVYCLYALPLPILYGMVQNQECIGILISSPEEAVKIYEILSNDKLSYNEVITTLKEKYVFVTFWAIEVTSAPKDPNYQLRKIQEANKKNLSDDETLIHYSQAILKQNENTTTENSSINTNLSEQNNKFEEPNPFEKEVDINSNFLEIQGCHIKPYNRIFEVKLKKSNYYIYSPIYILRQNSKKISEAIYIGILLKLSNKIINKRKADNMHNIFDKKNREQLLKILNYYLTLDKVSLRSINRLFTFNTTLFKEQKKMKQGTIEELSICSQEIISKFTNNIIEIIDYLPVYKNNQIINTDNSIFNPDEKVNYKGVLIPNFFAIISNTKKNCYIKFKSGEIGFKLDMDGKDIVLKFKIPSINKGFKTVSVNNMITVNVTKWYSINDIESYGRRDAQLANVILARIKKLYAPISDKYYTLASFFKRVDELKYNYKIKSLYERLSNCYPFTKDKYKDFCQEMKYLYNYIENPHLLKQDNSTNSNDVSNSAAISNVLVSNYNFKDYKGTNGVFYSLSNEADVINSDVSLSNIQAKFVKKFAYVPCTDEMKSVFSLLVIEIDLSSSKVNIECYGKRRINYTFNIEVSAYTFSFITPPKDNALYYARLISAVCNKMFKKYEHTPSISYGTSSFKTPKKYIHNDEITVIKYTESKATYNSKQTKKSYEITNESKDIHFRRGHWHYYWYGHRNSPDRYKKLKWVNETIVNRNADSIIIQL